MRNSITIPKVMRRLIAAEGYLELGMPEHALEELEAIAAVDAGPLQAAVEFYKGESLMAQGRHADAIEPLKYAAESIPAPMNKQAWLSLGECFRHEGDIILAEVVEMFAEEPPPEFPEDVDWSLSVEVINPPAGETFDDMEVEFLAIAAAEYDSYMGEELTDDPKDKSEDKTDVTSSTTDEPETEIDPEDEDYNYDHEQFEN